MHEHNESKSQKPMLITLLIALFILSFEFFGGLFSNSLALLSDAGHMLTDVMSLALALFSFWAARNIARNSKKTYGYFRLEILSALINGVVLALISVAIFWGAITRIYSPAQIDVEIMLPVAIVGLIANLISIFILSPHSHGNLNVKGAFWHVVSDTLSSVAVVAGGLIIWLTGFRMIDPILSILIGCLILRGAWGILSEAVSILLEAVPQDLVLSDVIKSIKEIEGIKELHHVHIWTITSGFRAFSAHVEIDDTMVSACSGLLDKINMMLHDKYNIEHATLQLECEACDGDLVCRRPHID